MPDLYVVSFEGGTVATDGYDIIDASSDEARAQAQAVLNEPAQADINRVSEDGTLIEDIIRVYRRGRPGHIYAALKSLPSSVVTVEDDVEAFLIDEGLLP